MLFDHVPGLVHPSLTLDILFWSDWTVAVLVGESKKVFGELIDAQALLAELVQANPLHTSVYFEEQWNRQREMQLKAITVNAKEKRERLTVLLQLEEELLEARQVSFISSKYHRLQADLLRYKLCQN